MSLTVNAKTYADDVPLSADVMRYNGPLNDLDTKDTCLAKRTAAKPSGDYPGNFRGEQVFTRTVANATAGGPTRDVQFRILSSIPLDAASADVDTLFTDVMTFAVTAASKDILKNGKIKQ